MEHRFTYQLSLAAHSEIKRLVGQCIPQVKSSHRAEAIARGLGFGTNAALLAGFNEEPWPLVVRPDRLLFEGFLATKDVDPETLQVDLLYDSVALATGEFRNSWHWRGPPTRSSLDNHPCWRCGETFFSVDRKTNRICHGCKIRDDRMPRADLLHEYKEGILIEVYFTGELPQTAKEFCARPGWTDVLTSGQFADSISMHVGYWEDAKAGRWDDVPRRLKRLKEADRTLNSNPFKASSFDW